MPSRRDALRSMAAGVLVPALQAQHQHSDSLVQVDRPKGPKNLSAADFQTLSQLTDLIIPRTDTPGAVDAGVPFYIDRAVGLKPALGPQLHEGLASFHDKDAAQQTSLLKEMDARDDAFFRLLKGLTIDGYYSSKEGLVQELGYHGNTYVQTFVGCTHPEHMPDAN